MARKKIRVTAGDIATGLPRSGRSCPVAQALQREIAEPGIWTSRWTWGYARRVRSIKLSERARLFITHFDRGRPVKPFNFFTEVPDA